MNEGRSPDTGPRVAGDDPRPRASLPRYGEKDTEKAIYFHISADQSVLCDKKTRVRTYMSV